MDTFWAECYELSQVASHQRAREIGESKLKFESMYIEQYLNLVNLSIRNLFWVISSKSSYLFPGTH